MKKNGFTLMELMMVVVILAILAAIAIPNGVRPLEFVKGRNARETLLAIYAAQREYCVRNGTYAILAALVNERYLDDPNHPDQDDWTFTATASGGGIPNNCGGFSARATRTAGRNSGEYMNIDQSGQLNPSGLDTWSP